MEHRASGKAVCRRPSKWVRLSLGAAILAAIVPASAISQSLAAIPAPSIVRATPAMWIVSDADTTIYLFGTFHALDPRTVWMENDVRRAFESADELVLETIVPDQPQAVSDAARSAGAPRSKFMSDTRAAMTSARQTGMSVDHGADAVLRRLAESTGKKVSGLEDFGEQLRELSSIPATVAPTAPIAPSTARPVTMESLFEAWRTGDGHAFADMLTTLEQRAPATYSILIARRNARWANWISQRLQRPGTAFVAVGTGHLAGKDSVQHLLAARGLTSTRIS